MIVYTETPEFETEVRRHTDGRGVDVVYDSVGKSTWHRSLDCLRPRGMMVSFGNASGAVDPRSRRSFSTRRDRCFSTRPKLQDYISDPRRDRMASRRPLRWVASGECRLKIRRGQYPSEMRRRHMIDLASRKTIRQIGARLRESSVTNVARLPSRSCRTTRFNAHAGHAAGQRPLPDRIHGDERPVLVLRIRKQSSSPIPDTPFRRQRRVTAGPLWCQRKSLPPRETPEGGPRKGHRFDRVEPDRCSQANGSNSRATGGRRRNSSFRWTTHRPKLRMVKPRDELAVIREGPC